MKILLVHNYYRIRGGEDIAYDNQKTLLKDYGHDIVEYNRSSLNIDTTLKKIDTSVSSFYSFKTYREIKRIIIKEKPDISHIHNIFPMISQSIYNVLSDNNVPIIQTIHNYRFFCSNGLCLKNGKVCDICERLSIKNIFNNCSSSKKFYNFLLSLNVYIMRKRNIYSKINHFVALSNFVKQKLIGVGIDKSKITVIRNILKEDVSVDFNKISEKKYFVYVGRLSDEKGILDLLEVFSDLKDIKLKILGDGPLYKYIKNLIILKENKNIELLGFVGGKEKYRIINLAYATIIPSICYEVSPTIIAESFRAGVPVIVNNIGSLPENITEGVNGYLYNNLKELRDIVLNISSFDQEQIRYIANECKSSYREVFDTNYNLNLLINLYKSILNRN